ncbi:MAG: hypothetical protein RL522_451 [Pseudomonadota bacterium]|jgi:uncharacterized OB-fold protein
MSARPPLIINRTSAPFWEGIAQGRLLIQFDPQAGKFQFFPRALSLHTLAPLEWRQACGLGTLVAFTFTHLATPGFEDQVPYLEGLVRLDEGPRVFAALTGTTLAQLRVGQRMRVGFGGIHPFHFQPADPT